MKTAVNILMHNPETETQLPAPAEPESHLPSHAVTPHAPEGPPDPAPSTRFETDRAEEKKRAQRLLSRLDQNQTTELMLWLSDEKLSLPNIREMVAAPPPEGFGITTHTTTLHRMRTALRSADATARINHMLESTTDIVENVELSRLTKVQAVISNLLHAHAFHLANEVPGSEVLTRILTGIEKLSALEHKRELLVLAREKLSATLAPATRRHHVDLNIVRKESPPPAKSDHRISRLSRVRANPTDESTPQ